MTSPNGRADNRLAAWAAATDRPIPTFQRHGARRGGRSRVALLALAVVALVGAVLGTFVVVGGRSTPQRSASPTDLATGAAEAIATAPGIEYRFSILVDDGGSQAGVVSTGAVDYTTGRFSGTAHGGNGQSMLLFGGPTSGAVVIADGRFVKTENGPWEQVADVTDPYDRLLDRARLSTAFLQVLDGARIDPTAGSIACGSETCRTVGLVMPAAGFAPLVTSIFGEIGVATVPDLAPIAVVLHIDPGSGFLRHLEARGTAGTTAIVVVLDLTRRDPPPTIVRPIP